MTSQTRRLVPLTSIRFLAAVHLFVFHIMAFHTMAKNGEGMVLPVLDRLPDWLRELIEHGYCSTGLFFLLSGFILAYLYIDGSGRLTTNVREFFFARWTRIYPLHILILLLIAPISIAFSIGQIGVWGVAVSGVLSVLLIQAWFPPYALSWNFPTWALSAVVFFYAVFPALVGILRPATRRTLAIMLVAAPLVSLVPTFIYLAVDPNGEPMSFWYEWIMRTPLLWLPYFTMGILLARVFGINRYETAWKRPVVAWRPSWGDAAAVALLAIMMIDEPIHNFVLRHGLLAPLHLILIYDLAQERGIVARLLSFSALQRLGDASFSIFMLQMPMLIIASIVNSLFRIDSLVLLIAMVIATVAVSVLSANYFEKPVAAFLRRRFAPQPTAAELQAPHFELPGPADIRRTQEREWTTRSNRGQ